MFWKSLTLVFDSYALEVEIAFALGAFVMYEFTL